MITVRPSRVPYAPVECVGPVQARILDRVARSQAYNVTPYGYLEGRAVRRLIQRGILRPLLSFPRVYTLTAYAHHCNWLVNR